MAQCSMLRPYLQDSKLYWYELGALASQVLFLPQDTQGIDAYQSSFHANAHQSGIPLVTEDRDTKRHSHRSYSNF